MTDKEILEFIYARMVNVHNENPNYDYMLRMRRAIDCSECPVCKERDVYEKEQVIKNAARKVAEAIDAEILAYIPRGLEKDKI